MLYMYIVRKVVLLNLYIVITYRILNVLPSQFLCEFARVYFNFYKNFTFRKHLLNTEEKLASDFKREK